MHGIIFLELKKYVIGKYNSETWFGLLQANNLQDRIYETTKLFDDQEIVDLVKTASRKTGISESDILEDFGQFLVPTLVEIYSPFILPEWKMLDLLENIENTIHRVVRMRSPGAQPPLLKIERLNANDVKIVYQSERKMCSLLNGIVKGVANYYKKEITLEKTKCMLHGDDFCEYFVSVI